MSSSPLVINKRLQSIDVLRGVVMVLMAIDHVRVYSGISANSLEAGIFFTRWITHFCAPAFTFFAGTSIFLMSKKIKRKARLSKQLVIRGLMLVVLELTVLHFFWTFKTNFTDYVFAGVIWMLGFCMVLMAGLIWLKPKVLGILGLLIIVFQQLFSKVPQLVPVSIRDPFLDFWKVFYPTGLENFQTDSFVILYVLIPWIGVMAVGYAFGLIVQMEAAKRKKLCIAIGGGLTALFLVIGTIEILRAPSTPESRPFIFQLLGQQKYPASSMFLMMTLGPLILLIPYAEKMKGWLIRALNIIGRVPLFYYVLHILLIHLSALVVQLIGGGALHHEWFDYAPFTFVPKDNVWSLTTLYIVFLIDVLILYFACRWYAAYKSAHPEKKWLKYL